ncbi:MAG: hypothetical protein ACN0LA_12445 [Candidatus Longimicrobiales bacterium M2_2A_002]
MKMGNTDRNPSRAVHPTVFLVAWLVLGFGLERLWPVALPGASFLEPLSMVLLVPALGPVRLVGPLILTVAFWGALQWLTVVREEAYLARGFGEEYVSYRSSVRPWC